MPTPAPSELSCTRYPLPGGTLSKQEATERIGCLRVEGLSVGCDRATLEQTGARPVTYTCSALPTASNVGVDAAVRATGTTLTTSQALIVIATMRAMRTAAELFLTRVPRDMTIALRYPFRHVLETHRKCGRERGLGSGAVSSRLAYSVRRGL